CCCTRSRTCLCASLRSNAATRRPASASGFMRASLTKTAARWQGSLSILRRPTAREHSGGWSAWASRPRWGGTSTPRWIQRGCARAAYALCTQLSYDSMSDIAAGIRQMDVPQWPYARARLLSNIANPGFRDAVDGFLAVWQSQAPTIPPDAIALALLAAAEA